MLLAPRPEANFHLSYLQLGKQALSGPINPDPLLGKKLSMTIASMMAMLARWLQSPGPPVQGFPDWALPVTAIIFCLFVCLFFDFHWQQYPAPVLLGMLTIWIYIDATRFHSTEDFVLIERLLGSTFWAAALLSVVANTYQLLRTIWLPFRLGADKRACDMMLCGVYILFPCALATGQTASAGLEQSSIVT